MNPVRCIHPNAVHAIHDEQLAASIDDGVTTFQALAAVALSEERVAQEFSERTRPLA
jgi:hypothetical protein